MKSCLPTVLPRNIFEAIEKRFSLIPVLLITVYATWNCAGADWPQWGGTPSKNMVSEERGLPDTFTPGEKDLDSGTIKLETAKNVRWGRKVCKNTYSTPVIAGGRVFLCGIDASKGGIIACLDEQTGRILWKWQTDKSRYGFGICATPAVDGDRLYVVNQNCEVMCLDVNGEADGQGGLKAKVVWVFDMVKNFKTDPADTFCGSCVVDGELLYAPTSNGINPLGAEGRMFDLDKKFKGGRRIRMDESLYKVPSPDAPNVVVFDKSTGRVVATDDTSIARNLLKGQWSSFALGRIGDRNLVFYGAGDGLCYAFESLTVLPEQPVKLKTVWFYDCNPPEYKQFNGIPRIVHYWAGDSRWGGSLNDNDGKYEGVAEIIGTPVLHKNRIYVAIGRDAAFGRGRGAVQCIDATKTGDITGPGRIWTYQGLDWSPATVSIADGLVYVSDTIGRLHCVDAETGQCCWIHETRSGMTLGSTLVADGKIFMPTAKGLYIMATGREKKVLNQVLVGAPIYSTPAAANGTLYVASYNGWLWAISRERDNAAGTVEAGR
jgi:outer membrane protein assembly factor BamB